MQRAIAELIGLGLIARRPRPDQPGSSPMTYVLCHPKEFELSNESRANWAMVCPPTTVPTPRQPRRHLAPKVAPPSATFDTPRLPGLGTLLEEPPPQPPIAEQLVPEQAMEQIGGGGEFSQESNSEPKPEEASMIEPQATPVTESAVITAAQNLWPHEEGLARSVRRLIQRDNGPELLMLAIELAGVSNARGFGWVNYKLDQWFTDGMDLDDVRSSVYAALRGKQTGTKSGRSIPAGTPPAMNYNPPVKHTRAPDDPIMARLFHELITARGDEAKAAALAAVQAHAREVDRVRR